MGYPETVSQLRCDLTAGLHTGKGLALLEEGKLPLLHSFSYLRLGLLNDLLHLRQLLRIELADIKEGFSSGKSCQGLLLFSKLSQRETSPKSKAR